MGENSRIAVAIDKKHDRGEITVLGGSMHERCSRISPTSAEQLDVQKKFRLDVYRSIKPAPVLTIWTAVSSMATRDDCAVGRSGALSASTEERDGVLEGDAGSSSARRKSK